MLKQKCAKRNHIKRDFLQYIHFVNEIIVHMEVFVINNVTLLYCVCNFAVPKCLSPRQAKLVVNNISHTDHSITLQLPNHEQYPECKNTSLASVEYTVYYRQIKDDRNMDCSTDTNSCSKLVRNNVISTRTHC